MRQPLTFVVTILFDERDTSDLRGRVRHIAGERELPFRHADELLAFMRNEAGLHTGMISTAPPETETESTPPDGM